MAILPFVDIIEIQNFIYTTGMEIKKLEIQTAVAWESLNVKDVYTYDEFKKELAINKIDDVFTDIKIKQDKDKYIFAANGKNLFAVTTETALTNRPQRFYTELGTKEKWTAEQQVLIRLEGLELQYIKSKNQEDLDLLKTDIAKEKTSVEKASDITTIKAHIERNITFLKQEKELAKDTKKDDRLDRGLRKAHKAQIQDRLDRLYRMKKQVERLSQNTDKKYKIKRETKDSKKEFEDVEMDDINGFDMKTTLIQFSDRLTEMETDQPNLIKTRNDIIAKEWDTTPYYNIVINDVKDAKKLSKALNKTNKEYALLDTRALTGAKRQEISQDLEALETYLNKVINNPNTFKPSETPFVPVHAAEFNALAKLDPTLAAYMGLNKVAGNTLKYVNTTNTNNTGTETNNTGTITTKVKKEDIANPYDSSKEAFEKWGINGISKYRLDQSNMKPQQKQFRSGVGSLALTGGAIFLGWKMLSSAFKMVFKSDRGTKGANDKYTGGTGIYDSANRARLGIPTALMFWSEAWTGQWIGWIFKWGALTEKITNLFPWGTATGNTEKDKTSDTSLKYKSFPWATALFNGLTYGEIKEFLAQDDDKNHMKINPDKYETLKTMFTSGSKKNTAAAWFLDTVGKDDEKCMIDLALQGMGITREDIQDDTKKDDKFNKKASDAIAKLGKVAAYMETNKYNKMNPETEYLVEDYIAGKDDAYTIEELDARGDVFYKETTVVDKTGLADKIKVLAGTDTEKEEELLLALNTFYDTMPTVDPKIDITGTEESISFKTYDQTTTINLKNKSLTGLTVFKFTSYYELFKAASLTNYIKKICKDKQANSEKPFTISIPGRDIEFDDAKLLSTKFDTEIVSAWRWWSLKKISPTLEENKQAYCDYLNAITPKFWKEKATT